MSTANRTGLAQNIIDDLGRSIMEANRESDESFPTEQQLCDRFSVSRSVVREAINVLRSKGLIESRPKRGIRILDPNNWNFWDPDVLKWIHKDQRFYEQLAEIRLSIEPAAAELAARHATPEQVKAIAAAANEMADAEQNDQPERFNAADERFHIEIATASDNNFMKHLIRLLNPIIKTNRERTIHLLHKIASPVPLHQELANAIKKGQPKKSRELMTKIIEQAKAYALKV